MLYLTPMHTAKATLMLLIARTLKIAFIS